MIDGWVKISSNLRKRILIEHQEFFFFFLNTLAELIHKLLAGPQVRPCDKGHDIKSNLVEEDTTMFSFTCSRVGLKPKTFVVPNRNWDCDINQQSLVTHDIIMFSLPGFENSRLL